MAGWDWNEIHRLECCVRMVSWWRYSVSGIIPDGGATGERYTWRSSGSSMMDSS